MSRDTFSPTLQPKKKRVKRLTSSSIDEKTQQESVYKVCIYFFRPKLKRCPKLLCMDHFALSCETEKRINSSLYFYLFINFILSPTFSFRPVTSEVLLHSRVRATGFSSVYCWCQKQFNEMLISAVQSTDHLQKVSFLCAKIETKESSLWLQKVIQSNPLRRNRQLKVMMAVSCVC